MPFNDAMYQGWGGFPSDTSSLNKSHLMAGTKIKSFEKVETKNKAKILRDQKQNCLYLEGLKIYLNQFKYYVPSSYKILNV